MDYEKFFAAVKRLAPGCKDEAIPLWRNFAAECVDRGQFVNFESTMDKNAAMEKWLDALFAGFHAVSGSFGQKTAAVVVDLSCERCCLYPGEMTQAAACLEDGGDSKLILSKIDSGEIDCSNLFELTPPEDGRDIP